MSGYVLLCPVMSGCPDSSAPYVAEVSLARLFGMSHDVRAAQRGVSGAPLAGVENGMADGTGHDSANATIHGPRQRRHLQAMLGRRCGDTDWYYWLSRISRNKTLVRRCIWLSDAVEFL